MADVVPPVTIQRDGEARSSLIRTDPYQETTNPRSRLGPTIASWTGCDSKGSRTFDRQRSVSATGCEGSHLEQKIRTFGSPRPYSEENCQTRPMGLDRKDSRPIPTLCRLSRDVMASYLSRRRTWNDKMRGGLFRETPEI